MINCFKCGKESVRSSVYFISSGASVSSAHLHGAAELGLCPDCIAEGYKKLSRKPSVTMILWLGVFFGALILSAKLGTGAPGFLKIICVLISIFGLYNGVRDVIVVSVYRKRRRDIKAFLPEMTQTDFNEQINTHLKDVSSISEGILFHYDRLRGGSTEIAVPFDLPAGEKRFTRRIKEEELLELPADLTDNGQKLDEETLIKIHHAVCHYWGGGSFEIE